MKAKILLIDDDTSLRRVLEYNLQEEGYDVQVAASGEEGLYLFGKSLPNLVITDMKMSGMDGLMVLKSIKERSPETLVVIITAFGTVDVAVEAMKAGAYDYPWPGNVRELENTIERLLIMRNSDVISRDELPEKLLENKAPGSAVINLPDDGYPLEQLEREVVVEALERNTWNQTAAARFLRIPRHTLIYRIEKYGIILPSTK